MLNFKKILISALFRILHVLIESSLVVPDEAHFKGFHVFIYAPLDDGSQDFEELSYLNGGISSF